MRINIKGQLQYKVNINIIKDTATINQVNMLVTIDKGDKVKIQSIDLLEKNYLTKRKSNERYRNKKCFRILKASKFIKEKYKTDLEKVQKPIKKDIEMLEYFLIRFLTTKEKNALN
jgi:outer membrane protein insertion porin family